ncbi:MAG: hypothetical protein JWQ95_5410 [Sphaerisporangium sp.]|nr:hypothetical protein [Sphaerisporangium sp.]
MRFGSYCAAAKPKIMQPTRNPIWFRTGPPRSLLGLRSAGYAVRTGVSLPPPSGPARNQILLVVGLELLSDARRVYGQILRDLLSVGRCKVPPPLDLSAPWIPHEGLAITRARQRAWTALRKCLAAAGVDLDRLEQRARAALNIAVNSFDHLEDTAYASEAHDYVHRLAELTAGLFGCVAERDGTTWFDVCRQSIMHVRMGMSVGFTAQRHCSVCDSDLSECEHQPGQVYEKTAELDTDDSCTICGDTECQRHSPGTTYPITAHAVVRKVEELHEISYLPRPRDPLARISKIEIPNYTLTELPNRNSPDAVLHCHRCISFCTGFTSAEEALGLI